MKEIIFFHAPWCAPCKFYMQSELPKIQKKYTVEIIDCEKDPFTADKYHIQHIPAVLILNNDKEIYRGNDKAEKILEILKNGYCKKRE